MLTAAYTQISQTKYSQNTRDAWEVILASLEHPSLATWGMVEESIASFPAGKGWDEFSIFITDGDPETVEISSAAFKKTFVAERHEFLRLYEEMNKNLSGISQKHHFHQRNFRG